MTLEPINPKDLPTPATYTHVIVATGGPGWYSSPVKNPRTNGATSSVAVIWRSRPARCSATSAVASLLPGPGRSR